jgi:hypothetical protein
MSKQCKRNGMWGSALKSSKTNVLPAINDVLAAATTPHDCYAMRAKLVEKGLHCSPEVAHKWMMELVVHGRACVRMVPDGPGEMIAVFEKKFFEPEVMK